jgi:hypothetical protein
LPLFKVGGPRSSHFFSLESRRFGYFENTATVSGGIFKMFSDSSGHQKHLLPTPLALFLKKDGPQPLEVAA